VFRFATYRNSIVILTEDGGGCSPPAKQSTISQW